VITNVVGLDAGDTLPLRVWFGQYDDTDLAGSYADGGLLINLCGSGVSGCTATTIGTTRGGTLSLTGAANLYQLVCVGWDFGQITDTSTAATFTGTGWVRIRQF
jgi:hypothetical protein